MSRQCLTFDVRGWFSGPVGTTLSVKKLYPASPWLEFEIPAIAAGLVNVRKAPSPITPSPALYMPPTLPVIFLIASPTVPLPKVE